MTHIESFYEFWIQATEDPMWVLKFSKPLDKTFGILEQWDFIQSHAELEYCNFSFARQLGQTEGFSPQVSPSFFNLGVTDPNVWISFLEGDYSLENRVIEESHAELSKRVYLLTLKAEIQDGKLLRILGHKKDITAIHKMEGHLTDLLTFSHVLNEISKSFLITKAELVTDAIQISLEELAKASQADRAFVAEISSDKENLFITHEWTLSFLQKWQDQKLSIPIAKMNPDRLGVLANDGVIYIEDTTTLHEEPWHQELFKMAEVRSLLVIGLKDEGNLIGILGITSSRQTKEWNHHIKRMLGYLSSLISQGLVRAKNEVKLKIKERALQKFYSDIKEDLGLAKLTQDAWVAKDFLDIKEVRIESRFLPYESVGGDLILLEKHSDSMVDFLFADISGHGISSALVSGIAAMSFKKHARPDQLPNQILKSMHNELKSMVLKHHISACCIRLLPYERKMIFSFAGHPPVIFWRKGEPVIELIQDEMYPILLMDHWNGQNKVREFSPGDQILLFSDGIYEVEEPGLGYLGLDAFLKELKDIIFSAKNEDELLRNLVTHSLLHKDRKIHDDIAMLWFGF